MEYISKEFGFVIDIPNDSIIFNLDDIAEKNHFNETQKNCCMLVFRTKKSEPIMINCLARSASKEEYIKSVNDFCSGMLSLGLKKIKHNFFTAEKENFLDSIIFEYAKDFLLNVFVFLEGAIFQANVKIRENKQEVYNAVLECMKTLKKLKRGIDI